LDTVFNYSRFQENKRPFLDSTREKAFLFLLIKSSQQKSHAKESTEDIVILLSKGI